MGSVIPVGLYGDAVRVAHGSRGGWDLLGPDREVTHSVGNVLYTMDNQPALEVYKKYLGERAEGLPATGLLLPLAIRNENDDDHDTVRTILAVDEQKQSIIFAGDIPEGSHVKLMRANFDRLVDGAAEAAEQLDMTGYENGPAICLAISCVGRRLVLGPRVEEELEAVKEVLPAGAGVIGYYSYGEISPLASGRCDLHNQTMTLTLIWEQA
nr:FIST C-terminal domain-containing protein [Solemya elarraichensis gill symbiont]